MLMEVLNHSLDLWVDVPPQLLCPCVYMGKPSDRPEIPAIVVDNLQVALPVLLHDPLVEELEHFDMPSTGNLQVALPTMLDNALVPKLKHGDVPGTGHLLGAIVRTAKK